MLTATFYRKNGAQKSRQVQKEATKTAEGLERVLELARRGEHVGSEKCVEAIDFAVEQLTALKSRMEQLGELRQVIEDLEKVAQEKKSTGRKRVDETARQLRETRARLDILLEEREILSAQIMAANALRKVKEERVGYHDAKGESSESSHYSDSGGAPPSNRIVISDYCKGDWDDKVTDDFPDK